MKKALDYVSDYQLKSACKDAICIAPSKVTQMISHYDESQQHIINVVVLQLQDFRLDFFLFFVFDV